ncbi:MAG: translation initiation factor IF-2 [Lentisphaerae bacterium]|nr:translation initiation factor IF-2 [Lentisphaerota bacterium]
MRVYELASELKLNSKELLAALTEAGISVKSHMSALDETAVELMRKSLGQQDKAQTKPEPVSLPQPEQQQKTTPKQRVIPKEEKKPLKAEKPESSGTTVLSSSVHPKILKIRGSIVVKEFAEMIGMRPNMLITELMTHNVLASINQRIDINIAKEIAEKHGFILDHEKRAEEHKQIRSKREAELDEEEKDHPEDLIPRPPVVTFLGHVDHGKTSLLDYIRKASVAKGEHGGITQHIGAYVVDAGGQNITFLDTPGHAAFTAMRARGANLTDIAVIIIAADDGIMPQTEEAIQHAKAANVAIMIAINKIDLPTANPDRVRKQLQSIGLTPEEWGGNTICVEVSAATGEGVDHLLEMILLQAEMQELKANPNRRACGFVIESQLEAGMGPTANLLVTNGTLKVGDFVLCGENCGKIRALINDRGNKINAATPAMPVKSLGFSGVPSAGEKFQVHSNEKKARLLSQKAAESNKTESLMTPKKVSIEELLSHAQDDDKPVLNLLLRADTHGSIEAITHALKEIKSDKISLNIILSGTGNITSNDVMLASASHAVIMGFHVAREPGVDSACRREGIETYLHHVIYELIDQVRNAMVGLLMPEMQQKITGHAEIRQVFGVGKKGKAAGCMITDGFVTPKLKARVMRNGETLFEGRIESLKHFQDYASEVKDGQECGIQLASFTNFEAGDTLEFYELNEVQQIL